MADADDASAPAPVPTEPEATSTDRAEAAATKTTIRRRVRKVPKASASPAPGSDAPDASGSMDDGFTPSAAALNFSMNKSFAESQRDFSALSDEDKMFVIRKWREDRDSQFMKTSTKFDLAFYITVLVGFYIYMYMYHNVDMIAVVRELSSGVSQ